MSNLPRITVITPSLNQGRYLERALCSVLDQGYENLQYLVMDGGSSDESVPLIQHYEDGIAHWHSRPDAGPADAINQALAIATGDYVCILPADSVLLPGALHAAAERMDQADWLVGHCQRVDAQDEPVGRWTATSPDSLAHYLTDDAGNLPVEASFFRRGVLERHGGFDREFRFAFGYEMMARLLAAGLSPSLLASDVAARREPRRAHSAAHVLQEGQEHVVTAERYVEMLPLQARSAVWASCEERRLIYAVAETECRHSNARRFLWQHLLQRPWWLANNRYRHAVIQGLSHSAPQMSKPQRMAA